MTPLRQALQDYLRIRRRLGFQLKDTERHLEQFVDFLEQAGSERITVELAVMWARMPVDAHPLGRTRTRQDVRTQTQPSGFSTTSTGLV